MTRSAFRTRSNLLRGIDWIDGPGAPVRFVWPAQSGQQAVLAYEHTGVIMLKGFKAFIMRGNVVELAIAVVIGVAFGLVVTALVEDIFTPLIAAIVGKPDFSALTFTIHKSKFKYGSFLNAVISFLAVAGAIYFFVIVPLEKIAQRRSKGAVAPEEAPIPSDEALLLGEIRDLLARQANSSS